MADRNLSNQDAELHIKREVQRRLGRQMAQHNEHVNELRENLKQCHNDLVRQHNIIVQLTSEPLVFGTLIKVHNFTDAANFKANDEVLVIDQNSPHYMKGGKIIDNGRQPVVDEHGYCAVKLMDETEACFAIGLEGKATAQIRLTRKADGTFAVVSLDGKPWEVRGIPDFDLKVGDPVKVKPDTKAIVSKGYDLSAGPICNVVAIMPQGIEVMHKGEERLVYNPNNIELEEGDRVACDPNMFCIVEKLPKDARQRYKLASESNVTWDDVGGLDGAKQELRDALELPYQQPELFAHYGVQPLRGVLLYGAPGCGKTLLARVAAWAMAQVHGKTAVGSGYIYVKSPEILDKWVGNTEKEIRELFARGRRHFREFGYKAVLVFDEADAIMPQRGMRRSSDVADTIVPMFLGEMDGIDEEQTRENPIVILLSNRADILDPAITRPGRISRHIKIERPNEIGAVDILDIHTKKMPFADKMNRMEILTITSTDLFSKSRLLYRINNEHDFTLGDSVNGAMLANIAEIAKMNALHRDMEQNKATGVTLADMRAAVQKVYRQQKGVNHNYDIADFCEKIGIQAASAKVERCFGAA